jgi:hypothetical protein
MTIQAALDLAFQILDFAETAFASAPKKDSGSIHCQPTAP